MRSFFVHRFVKEVLGSILHLSYNSEAVLMRLDYQILLKPPSLFNLADWIRPWYIALYAMFQGQML